MLSNNNLKGGVIIAEGELTAETLQAFQQRLKSRAQQLAVDMETQIYQHQTYATGVVVYTGRRQGKSLAQQWWSQGTNELPSKRAKGVRDAPHIAVEVKDDTLHLTAVNTQLGLHGLIPKMKIKLAPKWLTDKVAVLRIMEPYHDWVTGIGQRTGEDYFIVLCPYKYAPRKRRQPEVKR